MKKEKSVTTSYLFLLIGFHYVYLEKLLLQVLYILTFGGFGIWFIYDLLTLKTRVEQHNNSIPVFSSTGYFKIENNKLLPLNNLERGLSFNDIGNSLGFKSNDFYGLIEPIAFISSKIEFIAVNPKTLSVMFIVNKDENTTLSNFELNIILDSVDWNKEMAFIKAGVL